MNPERLRWGLIPSLLCLLASCQHRPDPAHFGLATLGVGLVIALSAYAAFLRRRIASLKRELALPRGTYRSWELLELAADSILHGAPDGRIIDANQIATVLTGYPARELIGSNIAILFTEGERRRAPLRYDLLKQGKTVRTERVLTRKDASEVTTEMHTSMLPDGTYLTLIRDISERKSAQQSLEKSRQLLHRVQRMAQLGSWEIHLASGVVSASPEAHAIYGLPDGELTLTDIKSVPLPEYRWLLDQALEGLMKRGERYDIEFRIRRRDDGKLRDIRSLAEYDPVTGTVLGSIQDVTDMKQIAEVLRATLKEKGT
jgi:PAS domain S-box-containing protein